MIDITIAITDKSIESITQKARDFQMERGDAVMEAQHIDNGIGGEAAVEIRPGCEIELSKTEIAEASDLQRMKTSWYMELDSENRVIEIRPGSDGCISLHGAQEAKHFIEVLKKIIQEIF